MHPLPQIACVGIFIWAAVVLVSIGSEPTRIVVRFFDMITIAVPPALPACLTIATVFSIGRLRRIGIYVTGPHTITLAGQLDIVCFDKTGEHCLWYAVAPSMVARVLCRNALLHTGGLLAVQLWMC
jgi:hypothetical protein